MSKIIDALRHEHESMQSVLNALEKEVAALAQTKQPPASDFALIWSAIDYFTDFPALVHHPKENLVFERLRQIDPAAALRMGDLVGSHAALDLELQALSNALKTVMEDKSLPRAELLSRAHAFIEHQRLHLAMEEAQFFPVAERTLNQDAWENLQTEMIGRFDPLIGGPSAERFEALSRHIESQGAKSAPAFMPERPIPR